MLSRQMTEKLMQSMRHEWTLQASVMPCSVVAQFCNSLDNNCCTCKCIGLVIATHVATATRHVTLACNAL